MRKIYTFSLLIFGLSLLLAGCATTLYVAPATYKYDDNISFSIEKILEMKVLTVGQIYYTPPKGFKVVEIWADITNNSTATQRIDLTGIVLVDTRSQNTYKVQYSLGTGIGGTYGRMQPPIGKGATKHRRLEFMYPDDEHPQLLVVNGQSYNLQYTSTPPPPKTFDTSNAGDE